MDNIQLILYIVFLVGYFLYKIITGKNKPVTRQNPEKFDQDKEYEHKEYDPMAEPKSFEEILEELTGGRKKPVIRSEVPQKPLNEPEVSQEEGDIAEMLSDYDQEEKSRYKKYENHAPKYSKLADQIDLDKLDISIGEVEEIGDASEEKSATNPYLAMFDDLESAKKAIVMSEIINRKY